MGIYEFIDSLDNKTLYIYIAIIVLSVFFFYKRSIGLNILLAILVSVIIIWYIHEKNIVELNNIKDQYEKKFETILPEPKEMNPERFRDIIDFIFSFNDFYDYNPQAFEEVMDNIEAFIKIYDIMHKDDIFCEYRYQIAETKKENILNAFHSLLFNLPSNINVTEKFDRAHKKLNTIMTNYLNELYDKCDYRLMVTGRNIYSTPIDVSNVKPSNNYIDKNFTYQIY